MNDKVIVILTAMNVEYKAVQALLTDITVQTHPMGTRFEVGHLEGGRCRVALALVGKGNQGAAVLTERAAAMFSPVAVVFVGVAGALRPHLRLGDVVVASHVYAYHGATSEDEGASARPRTWQLSHRAEQIAAHVERDVDWAQGLPAGPPAPRVHFGPVAAGEIALYSDTSGERQWLRDHYNDAVAVEMEAAGVAAGHLNDNLPAIMIRGISHHADSSKPATDAEGWQPRAVANAAAFAVALSTALAAELDPPTASGKGPGRPGPAGPFNHASDNAHVGVQGQHVTIHGGIRFGSPGRDDESTAPVVADGGGRPGRLKLILNASSRFFRAVASLAASATAIITAVRSAA